MEKIPDSIDTDLIVSSQSDQGLVGAEKVERTRRDHKEEIRRELRAD